MTCLCGHLRTDHFDGGCCSTGACGCLIFEHSVAGTVRVPARTPAPVRARTLTPEFSSELPRCDLDHILSGPDYAQIFDEPEFEAPDWWDQ
jgi:hypothetical protein